MLEKIPNEIDNLHRVLITLQSGTSPATRRAYALVAARWSQHCTSRGWAVWPADQSEVGPWLLRVLSHLQDRLDAGQTPSTLSKVVAGLKYTARLECLPAAQLLTNSPQVRAFLAGVSRLRRDDVTHQAAAFSLGQLRALHTALAGPALADQRNRALIALGVATALRASSLAALSLDDLTVGPTGVLRVHVRHSKTDQTGQGASIAVLPVADVALDPVQAVLRWADTLTRALPSMMAPGRIPLFPRLRGGRIQPVPLGTASEAMTDLIRAATVRAGITDQTAARAYSSHSLRSTFITLSAQAGVSEARIAAVSGHRNLTVLRGYDRTSDEAAAQIEYLSTT